MKRLIKMRIFTTCIFMVLLIGFSTVNFFYAKDYLIEAYENSDSYEEFLTNIKSAISDNVYLKNDFVNAYGAIQLYLDKNSMDSFDIVKDVEGNLFYSYFYDGVNDTSELSERTSYLSSIVEASGGNLMYLMSPDKEIEGYTEFDLGIPYPKNNETADQFLTELSELDVEYLDFREGLLESSTDPNDIFYSTDHHWQTNTAFWAFDKLVDKINDVYGVSLDTDNYYTNIDNYNQTVYEEYLGSLGRNTGVAYSGIEDFTLITPEYDTSYNYYYDYSTNEEFLTGPFDTALINQTIFDSDFDIMDVEGDKYMAYLYGNRPLVKIENTLSNNDIKVLFIKDSYAVPLCSFFSTVVSEVQMIDPRYYEGSIDEYILANDFDYVFVSFYPPNLTSEFFDF